MKLVLGFIAAIIVWVAIVLTMAVVGTKHHPYEPPTFGLPCRLPDLGTEYRVIIQTRNANGNLDQTCSIEPLDQDEGRYKMMQRLLRRQRP